MQGLKKWAGLCLLMTVPGVAAAATFTVGPTGRQYTQLSTVFSSNNLAPGDIVEVDGNATYSGNIVVGSDDSGTQASPIIIRWRRVAGATRPVLQGGTHTIKFEQSNHVVFEGFEVRGGSSTCVFSEAHNVTVRDAYIHDCPSHGILGADQNSGSFTLEYSEIARSGSGTTRHSIYMQSDEVTYPNSVFRMHYNYVHDGTGGVLVRTRHERSLIYYNWIENAVYGEMELIGPDCDTQKAGWTTNLRREDADVVGNVIVHTNSWRNAVRAGGDLDGRSQGRVRMVNNTIVFDRSGVANAVMVQLGLGSLEMHNNVVYQTASGSTPAIVRENPASDVDQPDFCEPQSREPWSGTRQVAGSNNWVQSAATLVPAEWSGTLRGADPMFANVAQRNLRPRAGSPLINAGNNSPTTPAAFPFPSPQPLPAFDPPMRAKMAIGDQHARLMLSDRIDIGALEQFDIDETPAMIRVNGSQPLIPPRSQATSAQNQPTQTAPAATTGTKQKVQRHRWRQSPTMRYRRGIVRQML
ncbi:right-handed parallel beta-helix repeat-containing protein [Pseudoxanthomonas sp. UTMC 1351]|uniref:right-handed parallel beta-helix repeat-containing protein n=1 Tax=Pseudoxanthomonas sp. UTMC 1351 TaxID=2695853 RepID=UPI0034CD5CE5